MRSQIFQIFFTSLAEALWPPIWVPPPGCKRASKMSLIHFIDGVKDKGIIPVYKPLVQPPKQPPEQQQREKVEEKQNSNRIDRLV